MKVLARLLSTASLLVTSATLARPRSGWARLALFVPKLFAGSRILFFGAMGLCGSLLGWICKRDWLSVLFGITGLAIALRHIARIANNMMGVDKEIREALPARPAPAKPRWRTHDAFHALRPAPPGYRRQQDVQVGEHRESGDPLLADLWRPAEGCRSSGLGIIYLHGSGWHYAGKDFGTRPFFRHLTHQGHVVADLAYTLAPQAGLLAMVADVKRALAWMKHHARDLGIERERIVLMGGSAGGHLALLAAYTPNHPTLDPADVTVDTTVRAVISYYGPPDLRAQFASFDQLPGLTGVSRVERSFMGYLEKRFGFSVIPVHSLLPSFLGGTPAQVPQLYDLASPCRHVGSHCPATLLLQGTHDFSGVTPEVRKLHAALRRAGCRSFLFELPDTEHGFDLYKPEWSPAAQAATRTTLRFLAALDSRCHR